jgi:hypothetical protein
MENTGAVHEHHTKSHVAILDDVKDDHTRINNLNKFEIPADESVPSDKTCPLVFRNSFLIIIFNISFIFFFTGIIYKYDNIPFYVLIPIMLNWSLILTSIPMIVMLVADGTQNSVSGIVAQRLKPSSYFVILFISILAVTTSFCSSVSFINSVPTNKEEIAFPFLFSGPILMCCILIYPLIVKLPLHSIGIIESLKGQLRLDVYDEVEIITHTRNKRCSETTHILSVFTGLSLSYVGVSIELSAKPPKGFMIAEIIFLILSAISGVIFAYLGKGVEQSIYTQRTVNSRKASINAEVHFNNMRRIIFEYLCLIFIIICQNLIYIEKIFWID